MVSLFSKMRKWKYMYVYNDLSMLSTCYLNCVDVAKNQAHILLTAS